MAVNLHDAKTLVKEGGIPFNRANQVWLHNQLLVFKEAQV